MVFSLRIIALLMLVAGISLGVFASTLIAGKRPPVRPSLDQTVEREVEFYREFYDLDVRTTDAVRRELQQFRRELKDTLMALQRENADRIRAVKDQAWQRIVNELESAGVEIDARSEGGADGR